MSRAAVRFDGAVGRRLMNTDWRKHFSLQHRPDIGRRPLLGFEKSVHRDSEHEHVLVPVARDLARTPWIHAAVFEQRGHLLLGSSGPRTMSSNRRRDSRRWCRSARSSCCRCRCRSPCRWHPRISRRATRDGRPPPARSPRFSARTPMGRISGRVSTAPFRSPAPWSPTTRRSAPARTTATGRRRCAFLEIERAPIVEPGKHNVARAHRPSKPARLAPPDLAASSFQPPIRTESASGPRTLASGISMARPQRTQFWPARDRRQRIVLRRRMAPSAARSESAHSRPVRPCIEMSPRHCAFRPRLNSRAQTGTRPATSRDRRAPTKPGRAAR